MLKPTITGVILALLSGTVFGQPVPDGSGYEIASRLGGGRWSVTPTSTRYGTAWTRETLAPNAKTAGMVARLDKEYRANQADTRAWVDRYRTNALEKPEDSMAIFAWAYARELRMVDRRDAGGPRSGPSRRTDVSILAWMMAANHRPGDLDWTRMRLFVETSHRKYPELVGLARRLAQRFPRDIEIRRSWVMSATERGSDQDVRDAVREALDYQRAKPQSLEAKRLVHHVYAECYRRWKRQDDLRLAIAWAQKYIDSAPEGDEGVLLRERYIEVFSPELRSD